MNSEKTQIHRRYTTAPTRWLLENVDFSSYNTLLHFGEGRAFPDTLAFEGLFDLSVFAYDPGSPDEWKRDRKFINPSFGLYDVGVSNYVFNTLLPKDRDEAFYDMLACCNRCYIAVRTDRVPGHPHPLTPGVITQRGTFQTQLNAAQWQAYFLRVSPEGTSVTLLQSNGSYCILDIKRK
jgi:hypothetical protein